MNARLLTFDRADYRLTKVLMILVAVGAPVLHLCWPVYDALAGNPLRVTLPASNLEPLGAADGVTVTPWGRVAVEVADAPLTAWVLSLLPAVVVTFAIWTALVLLWRIVAAAAAGRPFTVDAVHCLRGIALVVFLGAALHWLVAGFVDAALSRRFLPENPVRVREHRFDWRDAVMNALTFGLMMASVEGFSHGLDPRVLSLGVAALIVVGFFFIRGQLREPYPILPFDLLRIPIFSVSVATSVCSFLGQMLAMVALPFYLQQACGYNDVETGLLLTAWPAVIMVVAPVAGLLVERIHAGLLGGTGLTMMAAGLFLLAFLPEHPTDFDIIWRLVLCGAGFGLFQSPNNSILIASAPPQRSGSASGMLATARLVGQITGAALMALLFHIVPENSTHTALLLAGGFALTGAVVSITRIRLPLPEGLTRRRK